MALGAAWTAELGGAWTAVVAMLGCRPRIRAQFGVFSVAGRAQTTGH